jgi:hypothetical protein
MTNENDLITNTYFGLTKLEYFAGMAMQGLLVNGKNSSDELLAEYALNAARALIKELNIEQ